jgi:ferredoxin--NADP+ reductase
MRGIRDDHRELSRIEAFLRPRGIDYATYQDWRILDNYEVASGVTQGRPRIKRTTVPEMMEVIHQGR